MAKVYRNVTLCDLINLFSEILGEHGNLDVMLENGETFAITPIFDTDLCQGKVNEPPILVLSGDCERGEVTRYTETSSKGKLKLSDEDKTYLKEMRIKA